jgi:hypothetical protein
VAVGERIGWRSLSLFRDMPRHSFEWVRDGGNELSYTHGHLELCVPVGCLRYGDVCRAGSFHPNDS